MYWILNASDKLCSSRLLCSVSQPGCVWGSIIVTVPFRNHLARKSASNSRVNALCLDWVAIAIAGAEMKAEKIRATMRKKRVERRMMTRILPTQRLILEIALSPDLSVKLLGIC